MKEVYSILGTPVQCEAGLATPVLLLQQDAVAELGPIGGDASKNWPSSPAHRGVSVSTVAD